MDFTISRYRGSQQDTAQIILNYHLRVDLLFCFVFNILKRGTTDSLLGKPEKLKFYLQCRDVQVYIVLVLFSPPEPKCITQSKTQRGQINIDKEPNLAPEPRS